MLPVEEHWRGKYWEKASKISNSVPRISRVHLLRRSGDRVPGSDVRNWMAYL